MELDSLQQAAINAFHGRTSKEPIYDGLSIPSVEAGGTVLCVDNIGIMSQGQGIPELVIRYRNRDLSAEDMSEVICDSTCWVLLGQILKHFPFAREIPRNEILTGFEPALNLRKPTHGIFQSIDYELMDIHLVRSIDSFLDLCLATIEVSLKERG